MSFFKVLCTDFYTVRVGISGMIFHIPTSGKKPYPGQRRWKCHIHITVVVAQMSLSAGYGFFPADSSTTVKYGYGDVSGDHEIQLENWHHARVAKHSD